MHKRNTASQGFTIVELLIVVVVVAILAAISIVTYTNIHNRAYDSVIQNDLTNLARKIQLASVDTGEYLAGGGTTTSGGTSGSQHNFPNFSFGVSKSAYYTETQNLFYCTGVESSSGQKIFQIKARSKSGNSFLYKTNGGIQNLGKVNIGSGTLGCEGISYPWSWSYGYYDASDTWNSWTN